MTRAHLTAAILLGLILAIGCGGAGSGTHNATASTDGTTGTTSTTSGDTGTEQPDPLATVTLEAFNVVESNPDAELLFTDPLNLETEQTVQFQLVDYAADGTRRVLPATEWSITSDANAFATISAASGRLSTNRAGSTNQFEVIVRYKNVDYRTKFKVNGRQANVFTHIVNEAGTAVRGVTLEFYNAEGLTVGRTHQPYVGYAYASVPTNASSFTVVTDDTLPSTYADLFVYDGVTYTAGDRNNPAPIGRDLVIGRNVVPDVVLVSATP